ncbi:MAG: L,D-transpeptidase [Pseudomonadota bacterium]|nr:L,D-transpeptidase [Pseudomonadota bacterium]
MSEIGVSKAVERSTLDNRHRRLARLLVYRFDVPAGWPVLLVSVLDQRLFVFEAAEVVREYAVSSSRFGIGSVEGSFKTPTGAHRVVAKIGNGAPKAAVFKGRKPTGKIGDIISTHERGLEDAVTSRIFQLKGLEAGINLGVGIDTLDRYVYLHGTLEEGLIGEPASIGCVRMKNDDIIKLYDRIPVGALFTIVP